MRWLLLCSAAFGLGAAFGYSRLLREWHFLIMLSTLLSWFVGLLLADRVNAWTTGRSWLAQWFGASYDISLVAVPAALVGWGGVYLWRELFLRGKRR